MARTAAPVSTFGLRPHLVIGSAVVAAVVLAIGGCAGAQTRSGDQLAPVAATSGASGGPRTTPSVVQQFTSVRRYQGVAVPVRLRIPEAGVDTSLDRLGLTEAGWIAAPKQWQVAGWYAAGPRPGQDGPSVIVGHVDSRTGPAVFHLLPRLRMGAAVYVDRDDGTSVTFRTTARRQVPKDTFPAADVYGPTLRPSLILMTCGGVFDPATGHYRDNILVTAVPG